MAANDELPLPREASNSALPYRIHPVRPVDSEDWQRLRNLLWDDEEDGHEYEIERYFLGKLIEPNEVLIARTPDGRAVGHIELSVRRNLRRLPGRNTGYVEGLYIEPAHRHRGLVVMLLRAGERWARERGCSAFASDREERLIVHRRFGQAV